MGRTRWKALGLPCLAASLAGMGPAAASEPAPIPVASGPPAPRTPAPLKRYAWTNNKWTGLGASLMSSGLVMAGGAGLALHAEPRPGNEDEDRFYHLLGIGLFCTSATSLVTSPIITSIHDAAQPDAPLPSAAFFVGAGAIAVGGGIVGVATLATLGEDARDTPWDDARGAAIAAGAMISAFGVGIALIGATDSGVPGARRPWQKQARAPGTNDRGWNASLRLGPGSAFVTGEMF